MLFEPHRIDERVRTNAGRAAAIWLGITQLFLVGVIFYRLYVLGQPGAEIRDFQAVLALSLFGHVALQLYMGGLLPVPTRRGMVVIYCVLFVAVAGIGILNDGLPSPAEWHTTWLPAALGPALFVGLYYLVAYLGKRRLERLMGE